MIANHNVIKKKNTDKNLQIDGLRCIAIIVVCIYHLFYPEEIILFIRRYGIRKSDDLILT